MKIMWAMDHSFVDTRKGGDPFSTRILAEELSKMGHRIWSYEASWPDERLPFYMRCVGAGTRMARRARRVFRMNPPDVVIAQNHVGPYVIREAKKADVPVVYMARDKRYRCPQFPHEYMGCSGRCAACTGTMALVPYPWFRHHINMHRNWIPRADGHVTNSNHMARDMRTWLRGTRPAVVYPPIDDRHLPDAWRPRDVLYMGKGHYKGADIVIEIAKAMPETSFRVCGLQEPSHAMQFQALPNVEYLGFVDRKVAYERAAVHIAPARWDEPAGRCIIEAASIGIPSIVSTVGGQGEVSSWGDFLIDDVEDIDQWVQAITDMTTTPIWLVASEICKEQSEHYHGPVQARHLERALEAVTCQ